MKAMAPSPSTSCQTSPLQKPPSAIAKLISLVFKGGWIGLLNRKYALLRPLLWRRGEINPGALPSRCGASQRNKLSFATVAADIQDAITVSGGQLPTDFHGRWRSDRRALTKRARQITPGHRLTPIRNGFRPDSRQASPCHRCLIGVPAAGVNRWLDRERTAGIAATSRRSSATSRRACA